MSQADPVRNWIFHFRKTENLAQEKREMKHRADAAE